MLPCLLCLRGGVYFCPPEDERNRTEEGLTTEVTERTEKGRKKQAMRLHRAQALDALFSVASVSSVVQSFLSACTQIIGLKIVLGDQSSS